MSRTAYASLIALALSAAACSSPLDPINTQKAIESDGSSSPRAVGTGDDDLRRGKIEFMTVIEGSDDNGSTTRAVGNQDDDSRNRKAEH